MSFDNRLLRITIMVGEEEKVYENLTMVVNGTKFTNANASNCIIQITNLTPDIRNQIASDASPYIDTKQLKTIKVEAGRESTGLSTVFEGSVWRVNSSPAPDITTTLICNQAMELAAKTVKIAYPGKVDLKQICTDAAASMGKILVFEGMPKKINNYWYAGSVQGQIRAIKSLGNYTVFIDAGEFVVTDKGVARERDAFKINFNNIVGKPQITEVGTDVTFMFDPGVAMDSLVSIDSKTVPQANGDFKVYMLNYTLANRDPPWYLSAQTSRAGI